MNCSYKGGQRKQRFILILALLFTLPVQGQKKPKALLAKERAGLEDKISLVNTLLAETAQKTQRSRNELSVLNQQVHLRESLVHTLTEEVEALSDEIGTGEEKICYLEENVEKLRIGYAKVAQKMYLHHHSHNFWLALLSSRSISEVFLRITFYRQITNYHKEQIRHLMRTETEIQRTILSNRLAITEKYALMEEKQAEMVRLDSSKSHKATIYQSLKSKEQEYRAELDNDRAALADIIKNMEVEETPPPPTTPTKVTKDPTVKAEAKTPTKSGIVDATGKDFEKFKGKMPWPIPTSRGVVIGEFGKVEDEYGNPLDNEGLYIRCPRGQEVTAIYDGRVTAIGKIPMSGTVVMLAHGNYRTVYANLVDVVVEKDEIVKSGQAIGVVRTDPRSEEAVFEFRVHSVKKDFLDPREWLVKD